MKRLMIASLAAATLAASFGGAASAQNYARGYNDGYAPIGQRLDRIDQRIDRGLRQGDLTRREATLLRRDLNQVANLEQRYRYDGLSRWEREDLERRVQYLQQRVRFERRDPEQRYDRDGDDDGRRYGYNDRRY